MNEYAARINRVIDYIENNLDTDMTLEELSSVAGFSKYHFHRLFSSFTGETLFQFIIRHRHEKAAMLLTTQMKRSVTDIALTCGFTSSASFAKSFKNHFGISATEYRKENSEKSNLRQKESSKGKAFMPPVIYPEGMNWRVVDDHEERVVRIQEFKRENLLYIRYTGPYKGDKELFSRLWGKLCLWAGTRNLMNEETNYRVLYHNDPELTEEDKLRISLCLSTESTWVDDDEVGVMEFPQGKFAVVRFRLGPEEYQKAWDWVYYRYLPWSGYLPEDRPAMEYYPLEEEEVKDGRHTVDICVPVRPK